MFRSSRWFKVVVLGLLSTAFSAVIAACYGVPEDYDDSPTPGEDTPDDTPAFEDL